MKILILIFLFFFTQGISQNYQNNLKLENLFNELNKVNTVEEADLLEKEIWKIWHQHPKNNRLTEKLEFGTSLMFGGDYDYALKVFDNIIDTDPKWSEAWNKRATLLYLMNDFDKSLKDINMTLSLEPRHFGALSGQANIFIKITEYEKAIKSLKKILKFYPLFKNKELIIKLEKLILEKSI